MAVTLAILVKFFSGAMMVLECFAEFNSIRGICNRNSECSHLINDVGAINDKTQGVNVVHLANMVEQAFANETTCAINSSATHPGLT